MVCMSLNPPGDRGRRPGPATVGAPVLGPPFTDIPGIWIDAIFPPPPNPLPVPPLPPPPATPPPRTPPSTPSGEPARLPSGDIENAPVLLPAGTFNPPGPGNPGLALNTIMLRNWLAPAPLTGTLMVGPGLVPSPMDHSAEVPSLAFILA